MVPDVTTPALRLVIPSFNRACQLECLLRSLFETCDEAPAYSIVVFHRYTDTEFERGYEIVKARYPSVQFVEQDLSVSFKRQFLDLVGESTFFGFIADDMVIIDRFSVGDAAFGLLGERADLFALSLRLDQSKTFSQPIGQAATSPRFDEDLVWRWKPYLPRRFRGARVIDRFVFKAAFHDWAAPCVLDGNIYRTEFFRRFFETVEDFEKFPFMEHSVSKAVRAYPYAPPNMVRYPQCKMVSLAMNSVDAYHDYPSRGLDPSEFNARFLAGARLDYMPFRNIVLHSCHVATEPFWLAA